MGNTMISVICASRNEEKDILNLCRSFVAQTYAEKELLIIDDSTDDTRQVVEEFIKDKSLNNIIFIQGTNDGCCPARNIGVKSASGDVICYMTADSYFPNDEYLAFINKKFQTDIDAYMPNSLVGNQEYLYADFIHCWQQHKLKIRGDSYSPLTSQGYCVKKSAAISVGLIDELGGKKIPFNVCRDWTLIKKMDAKNFIKEYDETMLVTHTAPYTFDDFFWTHKQRGVISGGYNLYFRKKNKFRFLSESLAKVLKSLLFYSTIFLPLMRANTLRSYSSNNRSLLVFLKVDMIKTYSFHYGEISVIVK